MRRLLLPLLLAVALPSAAHAASLPSGPDWYKDPSVNATWTQAYITEADGTILHADILRPKGVTAKTPVIMSLGPYFNHSGQTDPSENPAGTETGPSTRFTDFVVGAKLMQRGYAYVMVDLRGYGGSTGCSDFGGAGEQADVKTAVEWAAKQPWSTGSVGLYGKSYDGVTGLIGEVTQPAGLKAIVSQEPVYDEYDYLYTNREKYENFVGTPAVYQQLQADPGVVGADDVSYQLNAAMSSTCYGGAIAQQSGDDNRDSAFWKQHNYTALAKGHTVPLLLTQGFLEDNTKPLGAWGFYNAVAGPKRGWFDMSDHIRGNDQTEGDNTYPEWFDEVMRWYDYYVKGDSLAQAPVDQDPANEVETDDHTWRAESAWPPVDSVGYDVPLNKGSYTDDTLNNGSSENATGNTGEGLWTISAPLTADQRLAGVPQAHLNVTATVPDANLAANIYDIAPGGKAIMLSRSTYLLAGGQQSLDFEMYGNDWKIPAGDRIGLLVSSSNSEWWNYAPTGTDVTVNKGSTITVPFLKYTRTATIPGKDPSRLKTWLGDAPFTIGADTIKAATSAAFPLPPAPTAPPASLADTATVVTTPAYAKTAGAHKAPRLKARARRVKHRRRIRVTGSAPAGTHVTIRVRRGHKRIAVRHRTALKRTFRVTFKVRRHAHYRVRVTGRTGTAALKPITRRVR